MQTAHEIEFVDEWHRQRPFVHEIDWKSHFIYKILFICPHLSSTKWISKWAQKAFCTQNKECDTWCPIYDQFDIAHLTLLISLSLYYWWVTASPDATLYNSLGWMSRIIMGNFKVCTMFCGLHSSFWSHFNDFRKCVKSIEKNGSNLPSLKNISVPSHCSYAPLCRWDWAQIPLSTPEHSNCWENHRLALANVFVLPVLHCLGMNTQSMMLSKWPLA